MILGPGALAGNLDAYISAVNRLPLLTQEEEVTLARRLRSSGDLQAAGQLVLSHLRCPVVSISRQYLGYGLPHGDLIQEGNVGLMKAVKRFDPEQGRAPGQLRDALDQAEIHEYILKNWRMVKVATTKAQRKLFFNLRSMKQSLKDEARRLRDAPQHPHRPRWTPSPQPQRQAGGSAGDGDAPGRRRRGARGPSRDDGEESYAPIAYLADGRTSRRACWKSRKRDWLASDGITRALDALDARAAAASSRNAG